jgi:transposase InsO family protein
VSRKRVIRLMQREQIVGRVRRRYRCTTMSDHGLPIATNLLDRRFEASRPNERWVGDTTELTTPSGKLYLAAIVDLYSRFAVGWAVSAMNNRHLTIRALQMAIERRCPERGLLRHSDQGSTYASDDYQAVLDAHGITCSMSRRGNCYDNAAMESWFSTLKSELDDGGGQPSRRASMGEAQHAAALARERDTFVGDVGRRAANAALLERRQEAEGVEQAQLEPPQQDRLGGLRRRLDRLAQVRERGWIGGAPVDELIAELAQVRDIGEQLEAAPEHAVIDRRREAAQDRERATARLDAGLSTRAVGQAARKPATTPTSAPSDAVDLPAPRRQQHHDQVGLAQLSGAQHDRRGECLAHQGSTPSSTVASQK